MLLFYLVEKLDSRHGCGRGRRCLTLFLCHHSRRFDRYYWRRS